MSKSPYHNYSDKTIRVLKWVIVPIATIGQIVQIADKINQGPMTSGLYGIPNIVWIALSIGFILFMGWMFIGLSKEHARRKDITKT